MIKIEAAGDRIAFTAPYNPETATWDDVLTLATDVYHAAMRDSERADHRGEPDQDARDVVDSAADVLDWIESLDLECGA